MDLKKPLSFQQQVDRLMEHGMYVESRQEAAQFLSNVNYYRFTGYALQFRAENGQDYRKGTSFEDVKKLYLFDEELRGILRDALERVETMLRRMKICSAPFFVFQFAGKVEDPAVI